MKTKANDSINLVRESVYQGDGIYQNHIICQGLTKREYFAAMMMQAMLSNSSVSVNESNSILARSAIQKADALIEHLNEDQDGKS